MIIYLVLQVFVSLLGKHPYVREHSSANSAKKITGLRGWLAHNCSYEEKVVMGGIAAVVHKQEQKTKSEQLTADAGLQDIESLRKNAQALVSLAKRVTSDKSGGGGASSEANDIKKLLQEYGLMDNGSAGNSPAGTPRGGQGGQKKPNNIDMSSLALVPSDVAKICEKALKTQQGSLNTM